MSDDDENREYEDADPMHGAVDRRDGTEDAYAEFSDELNEAVGLGDDDPAPEES